MYRYYFLGLSCFFCELILSLINKDTRAKGNGFQENCLKTEVCPKIGRPHIYLTTYKMTAANSHLFLTLITSSFITKALKGRIYKKVRLPARTCALFWGTFSYKAVIGTDLITHMILHEQV